LIAAFCGGAFVQELSVGSPAATRVSPGEPGNNPQ